MNTPRFTLKNEGVLPDQADRLIIWEMMKKKWDKNEQLLGIPPDTNMLDISLFIQETQENAEKILIGEKQKVEMICPDTMSAVRHILRGKKESKERIEVTWSELNKLYEESTRLIGATIFDGEGNLSDKQTQILTKSLLETQKYHRQCKKVGLNSLVGLADSNKKTRILVDILYRRNIQIRKMTEFIIKLEKNSQGLDPSTRFPILIFDNEHIEILYYESIIVLKMLEDTKNIIRSVL